MITLDAEKELGLKVGDTVTALVKSTSVMLEKFGGDAMEEIKQNMWAYCEYVQSF